MNSPLPTIDELLIAGSAKRAAKLAGDRLAQAAPSQHVMHLRGLGQRLCAFPDSLDKDLATGGASVGLKSRIGERIFVALVDGGGNSSRLRFDDGVLVAIDAAFVLKAALLVFFAVRPRPYAHAVGALLFALAASLRSRPLPFQTELTTLAWLLDEAMARSVVADVGDFVTLHEVGHAYVEKHGRDYVAMEVVSPDAAAGRLAAAQRAGLEVRSFRAGEKALSAWDMFHDPRTGKRTLVLPGWDAHELEEFAPDVFALLSRAVLDSQGPIRPELLGVLAPRYAVWTWLMLLQEAMEDEAEGGGAWRGMRRLIRQADGARGRPTHPAVATRNEVLLFHMRELLQGLNKAEADRLWNRLTADHGHLWSQDFHLAMDLLIHKLADKAASEAMQRWTELFDEHDAPGGHRYRDLSPVAKYVSIRALGELRGVAPAILRGELPRGALPAIEREVGGRVQAWIDQDPEVGALVRRASRAIADMPKFKER